MSELASDAVKPGTIRHSDAAMEEALGLSSQSGRDSVGPRGAASRTAASKKWMRLRKATSVRKVLATDLMGVRAERAAASAVPTNVLTRCSRQESLDATPYWMQGDESMYSVEALQHRFALRNSPVVLQGLQVWWEAALRSVRSGSGLNTETRIDVVSRASPPTARLHPRAARPPALAWRNPQDCAAETWSCCRATL